MKENKKTRMAKLSDFHDQVVKILPFLKNLNHKKKKKKTEKHGSSITKTLEPNNKGFTESS